MKQASRKYTSLVLEIYLGRRPQREWACGRNTYCHRHPVFRGAAAAATTPIALAVGSEWQDDDRGFFILGVAEGLLQLAHC